MAEEDSQGVRGFIITIDGPAGAGKSTLAKLLAGRLGFRVLNTGALYRALAIHLMRLGVSPGDTAISQQALESLDLKVEPAGGHFRIFLGSEDISELLPDEKVGEAASVFSARAEVRRALLGVQRSIGYTGRVVAEGRDMGTVVFPEAGVKFFLTAGLEERSRRRLAELIERGEQADWGEVRCEMDRRDCRDQTRTEAPLTRAADAFVVDTTELSVSEVLERMVAYILEKFPDAFAYSA